MPVPFCRWSDVRPGAVPRGGRVTVGRRGLGVVVGVVLAGLGLQGCAPALDWRDVRPDGGGLQLQFPCKPNVQVRKLMLSGARVDLGLHACSAGGLTWGLAVADMGDPALVGPALDELANAAAANIGTAVAPRQPLRLAGATPNPASGLQRLSGKLPDGKTVQMQAAVFTRGTLVFQASVLGDRVADDVAQTFFDTVRFSP